jgi:hypothetical protein
LTLWHIGNTTVRTPYRLKEALQTLKNSEFHGNLLGVEHEEGFARLLNEKSIVKAERIEIGKDSSDLGLNGEVPWVNWVLWLCILK